jgi:DNA-directed RNA polymerase specialized sigma24 family protein
MDHVERDGSERKSQEDDSVAGFFQQLRLGNREGLEKLWQRFRPRLLGLATATLAGKSPGMTDAEDALQSAMVSFWQRAERGDFGDNLGQDDLWQILAVITKRKALRHKRREYTQSRGSGQVVSLPDEVAGQECSPSAGLEYEELFNLLDPSLRTYALLRLLGYTNREVAAELGRSERSVERKLELIRTKWDAEIARWTD